MTRQERTALFVRLTAAQAERLDQAASAVDRKSTRLNSSH